MEGELHVLREDAQQLLEIKAGKWTLDEIKVEAARLFASAETAFIQSKLPVKPDHEKINKLCVDMAKCWELDSTIIEREEI